MTEASLAKQLNAPIGYKFTNNIDDLTPGMRFRYWGIQEMSDEILILDIDYEARKVKCLDKAEFILKFDRVVVYIPEN